MSSSASYLTAAQVAAGYLQQAAQPLPAVLQGNARANVGLQLGITVRHYLGAGNLLTGTPVTQETGGATNCLDHIDATATYGSLKGLPVGYAISFISSTPGAGLQKYNLASGAVAAAPGVILPVNYNPVTQPLYWQQV